jgi:chemotaxis protein MotB
MAEDKEKPVTIVVKRIKKGGGGHHGGAWKIAYADFVTAMMAFFLLMWLLGSTTQGDLKGIADYFQTPLKVAMMGGSGAGGSNSILTGGGKDLTKASGQFNKSEVPQKARKSTKAEQKGAAKAAAEANAAAELKALKILQAKIEEAIKKNPDLNKFKDQLLLDITSDGLRIQVVDEKNRPMFLVAKATLEPYAKTILQGIGQMLNDVPNKISLSGHTDSRPFATGEKYYSNWELSTDRANASRRELIAGGMREDKVLEVVGLSSAVLYDKEDPQNPINRRIAIVVMNQKAVDRILKGWSTVDVNDTDDAESLLGAFKEDDDDEEPAPEKPADVKPSSSVNNTQSVSEAVTAPPAPSETTAVNPN